MCAPHTGHTAATTDWSTWVIRLHTSLCRGGNEARGTDTSPHWAHTWRQHPLSKQAQVLKVNDFTHIYFCAENSFWFIQNKEEILNTTDMIWRVISKGHLGLTSAPFPHSLPNKPLVWWPTLRGEPSPGPYLGKQGAGRQWQLSSPVWSWHGSSSYG